MSPQAIAGIEVNLCNLFCLIYDRLPMKYLDQSLVLRLIYANLLSLVYAHWRINYLDQSLVSRLIYADLLMIDC